MTWEKLLACDSHAAPAPGASSCFDRQDHGGGEARPLWSSRTGLQKLRSARPGLRDPVCETHPGPTRIPFDPREHNSRRFRQETIR